MTSPGAAITGHPCVCGEQSRSSALRSPSCGSSLSCYTVAFREVIECVLAALWGDSPDRETRFPELSGAAIDNRRHMNADLGFRLVKAKRGLAAVA